MGTSAGIAPVVGQQTGGQGHWRFGIKGAASVDCSVAQEGCSADRRRAIGSQPAAAALGPISGDCASCEGQIAHRQQAATIHRGVVIHKAAGRYSERLERVETTAACRGVTEEPGVTNGYGAASVVETTAVAIGRVADELGVVHGERTNSKERAPQTAICALIRLDRTTVQRRQAAQVERASAQCPGVADEIGIGQGGRAIEVSAPSPVARCIAHKA